MFDPIAFSVEAATYTAPVWVWVAPYWETIVRFGYWGVLLGTFNGQWKYSPLRLAVFQFTVTLVVGFAMPNTSTKGATVRLLY
jgi:hypothetical protein